MAIVVYTIAMIAYAVFIGALGYGVVKLLNLHPVDYMKERICHG